jgi:hypothetical protein
MITTSLSGIYLCGAIAFSGAWLLRWHSEARYRFAAATMMMGAWLCTAGIAFESMVKQEQPPASLIERPHTVIASR